MTDLFSALKVYGPCPVCLLYTSFVDGEFIKVHRSSPTISSKLRFLLVSALSIKLTPIELGCSDCDRTCAALS